MASSILKYSIVAVMCLIIASLLVYNSLDILNRPWYTPKAQSPPSKPKQPQSEPSELSSPEPSELWLSETPSQSQHRAQSSYLFHGDVQKPLKRYRALLESAPVSKDLTINRVHFDDRKKLKRHNNQTVFFFNANWTIFKKGWIVGCGIRDIVAETFKVRLPTEWYWASGFLRPVPFKYEHLYVDCYDLPVNPGDRAFLMYKTSKYSNPIVVESEHPVIFPKPRVKPPKDDDITIVTCIKANSNFAPFLGELINYQKALDVDHVALLIISPFIKDGGLKTLLKDHPYVIKYILEGYVTIDYWKEWYKESLQAHEIRMWSESIRRVSCSYTYRGTYDYVMPIDTDDFFTPRVPNHTSIKYYLKKYCYSDKIGSCMFRWVWYYPEFCGLNEIPKDGNVTSALKSFVNKAKGYAPKSIHKTTALIDCSLHEAAPKAAQPADEQNLMPGYRAIHIPMGPCFVAHMRKNAKPESGKCF